MTDFAGSDLPAAALKMDALAPLLMAQASPVRFGVADSPGEREAIYRLRYQVVVEKGWARPEDLPDGLERDEYDDLAVHLVGWDEDALVTTARLVFPKPGLVLPTEREFDLLVEPRGQVVDIGRFIVARRYSDRRHRVALGLIGSAWQELRARGIHHACGAFVSAASIRLYRRMGFVVTILAPARHAWGEERYPIHFDFFASAQGVVERWEARPGMERVPDMDGLPR